MASGAATLHRTPRSRCYCRCRHPRSSLTSTQERALRWHKIGALIATYTISVVPYCNYSMKGPKTLIKLLRPPYYPFFLGLVEEVLWNFPTMRFLNRWFMESLPRPFLNDLLTWYGLLGRKHDGSFRNVKSSYCQNGTCIL